ncbi:MAG TPA: glycosyltransferase family 4 protein [Myxococcales bacterium]|nr:glycosyltransferase family 4 protein [Myxococcales bacterium]
MIPVLHLRQGTALYGADRAVLALSASTPEPYLPIVGGLARPGMPDALAEEARRRGLPALHFDSASRFDLRCARAVASAALAQGVRLLHAHDFKALFVALVAGWLARIPVVATFHGDTRSSAAVRLYEGIARMLGNFTRGVAAVSRALEGRLHRWVRAAPVAFVPNGLPEAAPLSESERAQARAALGVPADALCVAVLGRLSPEKGHRVLFEAARDRPLTLLVAGDGPLRAQLERDAAGLDARFLGYLEDTRPVFAAADVVALPSLTEGLPLVALEALALGRCVVASAVGELPRLLADGAGLLVPPGDAAALSEALATVENGEVRARAGQRALERARDYGVAAMAGAYVSLYGRALSGLSSSR